MGSNKFNIQKHTTINKKFEFSNSYISMMVDYDDVCHHEVDAAIETMKEILDKYWDEELFKEKKKEILLRFWNENKYNLQSDYDDLEDYLSQNK